MHEYDHHIGDYTRDTVGLSMAEDGCYRRLLDQYYARELPLPIEKAEVYKMVRARNAAERKLVDYLLDGYFVLRDDGWHQIRADREIAAYHAKSEKARAAAAERWERERERQARKFGRRASDPEAPKNDANAMRTHAESDANAMQSQCERIVDNHANAKQMQCERNANAMPPARPRAHTRAGAVFRLPPSGFPSSDLPNRGSVVSPASEAQPPVTADTAKTALEKTGTATPNGKGDGKGMQWSHPPYVAATARTLGISRRENEDDDAFKDRVYAAVHERVQAAKVQR